MHTKDGARPWAARVRPGPRRLAAGLVLALVTVVVASTGNAGADERRLPPGLDFVRRTLDGSNNNLAHPNWGRAGVDYSRTAAARYADGMASPMTGPSPRHVSNRVFNDSAQNLFSENGVTQWGFAWGQFLDHTFGLRAADGGESQPLDFTDQDSLEDFLNDFGAMGFTRSPAAPGTGETTPRQQTNTVDSYIDASTVYGNSAARLDWLREGPVDGNPANNQAVLLLPDGQLPTVGARGNPATAPPTDVNGHLLANPERAVVAGDTRANENLALQSTHTLFALEHNRIVRALPAWVPEDVKFEIARRIVGAEQQYITYREFLPALGLRLAPYQGYRSSIDATLSNEFAVVGYRAHSMIHGELEPIGEIADYTEDELDDIAARGIEIEVEGDEVEFVIPLNVAFFNPDLVPEVGLGAILRGLGAEPQYKNDEQIDNQLRSVLFQVPRPGIPDPSVCLDGPPLRDCFHGVTDLGALDIERGRDHGMPSYNDLRVAYGLPPVSSFAEITGEDSAEFPADPEIDSDDPMADPDIMDFIELRDIDGNVIPFGSEAADGAAVTGVRRTTLAARLQGLYGDVDTVDAFVGMVSEAHLPGTEFGELQHAIWKREFERLRDGDRFFYAADPALPAIRSLFGIDYRRTLAQVIADNTDLDAGDIGADVFLAQEGA